MTGEISALMDMLNVARVQLDELSAAKEQLEAAREEKKPCTSSSVQASIDSADLETQTDVVVPENPPETDTKNDPRQPK